MAIVVEDGTGKSNSNSYVSLSTADDYHDAYGNTAWSNYDDTVKEAALLRACLYLETISFRGMRYSGNQALSFPRINLIDDDGYELSENSIPTKLTYAQMEAALREVVDPGCLLSDLDRGGSIKRKKVDVLETEYFDGAPSGIFYRKISGYLKGLTVNRVSFRVERG